MNLTVQTDRALVRPRSRRHLVLQLTTPATESDTPRPPADIAFVIDRSGSMNGDKFRLAREAIYTALDQLTSRDRFSIVAYDHDVDVICPLTQVTSETRAMARRQLATFYPRGQTNLSEGWLTGCRQLAGSPDDERIHRCLLLTDGLANHGITGTSELSHHAQKLRELGISTSTFGVGAHFDEVLLGTMADSGGGAFYFIPGAEEIPQLISQELGETLEIVARQVTLRIRCQADVRVKALGPYPVTPVDDGFTVSLPDLVSEQLLELPLEVRFPKGEVGDTCELSITVEDQAGVLQTLSATHTWTYAASLANAGQPRNVEVDRRVAQRYADMAREQASQLNGRHDYAAAAKCLKRVARRIEHYANDDTVLRELIRTLRREAHEYGRFMEEMTRKSRYYASSTSVRSGDSISKRRRANLLSRSS